MTPQQMMNAAQEVERRWPDASIVGFYGNASVSLDVVVDGLVVAQVSCHDGGVREMKSPINRSRLLWL